MKWEEGKRSIQETSGAAFIYVAFAMFGIMGAAGVAIDLGHWYATQRTAQAAADSAAVAGAFEALWGGNAEAIESAAIDQAVFDGFAASTVTVNSPPTIAPEGAAPGAVEVTIDGPTVGFFGSLFVENPIAVSTRWVTAQVDDTGICFVVFQSDGTAAELDADSGAMTAGCTVQVDPAGSRAKGTGEGAMTSAAVLSALVAGEDEAGPDGTLRFDDEHSAAGGPGSPALGGHRAAVLE